MFVEASTQNENPFQACCNFIRTGLAGPRCSRLSVIAGPGAQTSEPIGTYPADHIIRITALLEFDGKPVVVDELVIWLAEGAGGSTSGRQFLSFQPNRVAVAVETPDGGMIMLKATRSVCYTYGKTWGDRDEELTVVERLEKARASFVSVTQSFNTATSMGRLTLNVLLSFAQFEREVTAERIRDKVAASKKKGMWMGGLVPFG